MALSSTSTINNGETIKAVVDKLEARIRVLEEATLYEEYLRNEHPALQDLYEKYQLTKIMTTKK